MKGTALKFIAIDVETANANMASICSIGIAVFEHGAVKSEWYSVIDPLDYFDAANVSIHGISEKDIIGAPTFSDVAPLLNGLLNGKIVVSHTHFDRSAILQAAARCSTAAPMCDWLDSARVARHTWAACARSGYGLANVCKMIGYTFKHHNALEDAKAAGQVLLAAMNTSGHDLQTIKNLSVLPIASPAKPKTSVKHERTSNGPLASEVIVFTGELEISRDEASDMAAALGCKVANSVTKKTTILVVGDIDISKLAGHKKTSKHRNAESLISTGHPIRIIGETDFKKLVLLG